MIYNASEIVSSAIDKSKFLVGFRYMNGLNVIKRHKDNNNLDANNNVIYRIQCKDCDASHVGQTKRQLRTRVSKHKKNINQDITKQL